MTGEFTGERLKTLLGDCPIGRDLRFHTSTDSTNEELSRWANEGAPHGAAVVADQQTGGRGRLGRTWFSPPGVNSHTSVLVRDALPPKRQSLLVYLAGVAVAETIRECAGISPFLKWPNDVHVSGKKISGVLCESPAVPGAPAVVLGIGINVNGRGEDFPEEIRDTAASLSQITGRQFDRALLLSSLYRTLDRLYKSFRHDPATVFALWKQFAGFPNVTYRILHNGATIQGGAVDLDADGALLLRDGQGRLKKIHSGEVLEYMREGVEDASGH